MGHNTYIKKSRNILSKTLDGETVLVTKDTWRCYLLNGTGTIIWRMCNGNNSIGYITQTLSRRYDLKTPLSLMGVKRFLLSLRKKKLVEFIEQ